MRWLVALGLLALTLIAPAPSSRVTLELPYDLVATRDGTVYVADRSRILSVQRGHVRVHRRVTGASELAGLVRLADGMFVAADLPSGRILRVPRTGPVSAIATVAMPVDLLADSGGAAVLVASIADGVGLVRLDLGSGAVQPFARVDKPHGLDRLANGDLVVHDGHAVRRVDAATGAVTRFANVDAFEYAAARDGSVYGVTGGPRGGRVVRISPGGRVTPVAGTGKLGPQRDGRALRAPMLPSALALTPEGALLVAQIEPVPAIRRVDLRRGAITTIALGR